MDCPKYSIDDSHFVDTDTNSIINFLPQQGRQIRNLTYFYLKRNALFWKNRIIQNDSQFFTQYFQFGLGLSYAATTSYEQSVSPLF